MFKLLQVGRATAALAVVLHHATLGSMAFYGTAFAGFFMFGNIGVDFFFVLSGFIIYWSHRQDAEGLDAAVTYIKKRFIRLYPPFILVSLAMYILYFILPGVSMGERNVGAIPSFLLLPQPHQNPALSVSWTLMHELLFYSVFSIYFFRQKAFWVLILAWATAILLRSILGIESFWIDFLFSMHNLEFIMGVLVAVLLPVLGTGRRAFHVPILLAGTAIVGSFIMLRNSVFPGRPEMDTLYVGLGFALITLGLVLLESRKKYSGQFGSEFLMFLGAASYSIYLVHDPALSVLNRLARHLDSSFPGIPAELLFMSVVPAAVLAGVLYYLVWEKPVTGWARKVLMPHRAAGRSVTDSGT